LFIKVCCGWSHSIVRGVDVAGHIHFAGFGRSDFGQFPLPDAGSSISKFDQLPNGSKIINVWCGSEFTLAVGADSLLWGRGWNDHGNLGNNLKQTRTDSWVAVQADNGGQVQLNSSCWEGHVAVGGSHCLCIM
jgi:alpha-tubulin suppressor-like RCC1 family protein